MRKLINTAKELWHRHRLLILGLTAPLLALSALFLFLARPFSKSDLLLNIATDFITLIITIWYVDWILKAHEEAKWRGTHKYITAQAGGIAHHLISVVVEKAGLADEVFPGNDPPVHTRLITDIQHEILENVRRLDRDHLIARLDSLPASGWQALFHSLVTVANDISSFVGQFGSRLSPREIESLLSLRDDVTSAVSAYDLFKPFLGVPIEAMPKVKGGKPWEYAAIQTIRSGIGLHIALRSSLEVINVFDYVAKPPDLDWNEEVRKSWSSYWENSQFPS